MLSVSCDMLSSQSEESMHFQSESANKNQNLVILSSAVRDAKLEMFCPLLIFIVAAVSFSFTKTSLGISESVLLSTAFQEVVQLF